MWLEGKKMRREEERRSARDQTDPEAFFYI